MPGCWSYWKMSISWPSAEVQLMPIWCLLRTADEQLMVKWYLLSKACKLEMDLANCWSAISRYSSAMDFISFRLLPDIQYCPIWSIGQALGWLWQRYLLWWMLWCSNKDCSPLWRSHVDGMVGGDMIIAECSYQHEQAAMQVAENEVNLYGIAFEDIEIFPSSCTRLP